jgi:hypothetical protein
MCEAGNPYRPRPGCGSEDNIKMDLEEIMSEDVG